MIESWPQYLERQLHALNTYRIWNHGEHVGQTREAGSYRVYILLLEFPELFNTYRWESILHQCSVPDQAPFFKVAIMGL